ncbi:MAG TPA: hypothetical protein VMB03_06075 [Bryobacteraceae bacterium]|nr:hypothetical protein [Bryobacteraceae bacterium]
MKELKAPLETVDVFEIGALVGERRTLSKLAGGCSAADAECLRKIRNSKQYLAKAKTWDEFCPKYLGMSRVSADRLIRHLEEFGPESFATMQQLGLSTREYRLLAPRMEGKTLLLEGESVEMVPENGPKIHAALREIRQPAEKSPEERFSSLAGQCRQIVSEFRALCGLKPGEEDRRKIAGELQNVTAELFRVATDHKL